MTGSLEIVSPVVQDNPVRRLRGQPRSRLTFDYTLKTWVPERAPTRFEMRCPRCGERSVTHGGRTRKQAKDAYHHHSSSCGATVGVAQDVA